MLYTVTILVSLVFLDVTSCEVDGEDLTSSENSQEPGLKCESRVIHGTG